MRRPSTLMLVQKTGKREKIIHILLSSLNGFHHAGVSFVPYLLSGIPATCRLENCKVLKENLRLLAFALARQSAIFKVWRPV